MNAKRRTSSTQTYPSKRARTGSLTVAQTKEVDKEVKRVLARKTDYKYTDFIQATASIDFSGTVYNPLANLIRGDLGKDNFDGNQIDPKWFHVRYAVNCADSTATTFNTIRVIIGQSKLLAVPTPALVLENVGSAFSFLAGRNESRRKDYTILYDKMHTLNNSGNQASSHNVFIPGNRLKPVVYTANGALSITNGALFIICISDDGLTDYPDFTCYSRVKFAD